MYYVKEKDRRGGIVVKRLHAGDRVLSLLGTDLSLTAPLLNARKQVWVSQVLGDDHYKGLARITVGVAR